MNPNLYLSASGNVGNNAWDNMGDVEFHSDHDSAEKLKKDKFSGIKKFLGNIFHFSVFSSFWNFRRINRKMFYKT